MVVQIQTEPGRCIVIIYLFLNPSGVHVDWVLFKDGLNFWLIRGLEYRDFPRVTPVTPSVIIGRSYTESASQSFETHIPTSSYCLIIIGKVYLVGLG